jgi:hypothetical protein
MLTTGPIPAHAAVPYAGGGPDESEETLNGLNPHTCPHRQLPSWPRWPSRRASSHQQDPPPWRPGLHGCSSGVALVRHSGLAIV